MSWRTELPPSGADQTDKTKSGPAREPLTQRSYDRYHQRVAAGRHASHVRFMNFGYDPGDDPSPGDLNPGAFAIPRRLPNREGALLIGEVLGSEPLSDRVLLDVGCGRGGALWLAAQTALPRLMVGMDLNSAAVEAADAAVRTLAATGVGVADAEALPIAAGTIDIVLNVESSLHYPHLELFHSEVARVLRPDGAFCHADLFSTAAGDAYLRSIEHAGFTIESERDITANVIGARLRRADRQRLALEKDLSPDAARFVGAPGTAFFEAMSDGTLQYRILRARRRHSPPSVPAVDPRLRRAAELMAELTGDFDGPS